MIRNQRGAIFLIVGVVSLCCAIGTYVILWLVLCHVRLKGVTTPYVQAHYSAEAGIVWATQRIWQDPAFCTVGPQTVALPEGDVEVTVTNCAVGTHQILARKVY